jgi:hypothetical protein
MKYTNLLIFALFLELISIASLQKIFTKKELLRYNGENVNFL